MSNKDFSLLVKPASFDCNLRCEYCFYLKKEQQFGRGPHRMSDEILEHMIAGYLAGNRRNCTLGWQGGEPTVMGLDFFRRAVQLMQKHGHDGQQIANGLQTNGTLLDDDWAKFLAEYHFLVGVSVDGPPELHDPHRCGSHASVMRGIDALRRHRVEFNILTLVNSLNVKEPLKVYRYLRDELGVNYLQFIECVEPQASFALGGEEWGEFLCTVFDEWYGHDTTRVSVRFFDSVLNKIMTGAPSMCSMCRECGQYLVVEHDGGIYPCDFFVNPELRLGKVGEKPLPQFLEMPRARTFAKLKSNTDRECRKCPYFRFCAGDCTKNRRDNRSLLCAGYKKFYGHTLERFNKLAERFK